MASVQLVSTNTVRHTDGGYALAMERGPVTRRTNTIFEYVSLPVGVPRPVVEDFNSLVVVHNRMEFYS